MRVDKDDVSGIAIFKLSCITRQKQPEQPGDLPVFEENSQRWDIMAQISVDAFCHEGVIFVVYIVDVLLRKDDIQIPIMSARAIILRLRSRVCHPLDCFGRFILAYRMAHNLPWISAYH